MFFINVFFFLKDIKILFQNNFINSRNMNIEFQLIYTIYSINERQRKWNIFRTGNCDILVLNFRLLNKKFFFLVPVCPHGGGIGLCQMIQHLQIWDYICLSGTKEKRLIEYVDHLQEHFKFPIKINKNCYMPPKVSHSR